MKNDVENKEKAMLIARCDDIIEKSYITGKPTFLGFLDLREKALIERWIISERGIHFSFYGGYETAERTFLIINPFESMELDFGNYPINLMKFTYKKSYILTHRDFLGSFMSLGIMRSKVGDILVGDGEAFAFISENVSDLMKNELRKIGNVGVDLELIDGQDVILPELHKTKTDTYILSSMRIDQIVSAITNKSRSKSSEIIDSELVSLNFFVETDRKKVLKPTDTVSIRGYGRYRIRNIKGQTKKDKFIVEIDRFI